MRNRWTRFVLSCARLPGALAAFALLTSAGLAHAGRERAPLLSTEGVPPTPEPGAALAFAVGVGVIAWAVRRHRNR